MAWRYTSPVALEGTSYNPNIAAPAGSTVANGGISNTDARIASFSFFDLTGSVKLGEKVSLRLGVNNILDKSPPVIGTTNLPSSSGNGNTFPVFTIPWAVSSSVKWSRSSNDGSILMSTNKRRA